MNADVIPSAERQIIMDTRCNGDALLRHPGSDPGKLHSGLRAPHLGVCALEAERA